MSVLTEVFDAADEVHKELGAGFTESCYHRALESELSDRGVRFSSEGSIPVFYKGTPVGRRRPDIFVQDGDETIILELKAGSKSGEGQLLQYLDLLGEDSNFDIKKGVLIQFNSDCEITEKDVA